MLAKQKPSISGTIGNACGKLANRPQLPQPDLKAIGSGACAECGMHRRVPPGSNFQAGRRRNRPQFS